MDREVVFIHIPKAAGSSVWQLVERPRGIPKHVTHWRAVDWIQAMGRDRWEKSFSFAIVRNPYTRVLSAWHYLVSQTPEHRWWRADQRRRNYVMSLGETFEEFILKAGHQIAHDPNNAIHFLTQKSFLCLDDSMVISHLVRFEDLPESWETLAGVIGVSDTLPVRNIGNPPMDELTFRARMAIQDIYQEDFELLGYEV